MPHRQLTHLGAVSLHPGFFLLGFIMAKNTLSYFSRTEVPWFKQVALISLTLAVITYSSIIIARFITPLTWGITLAVTINPLYKRILKSFAYPSLVAGLFTLILGFGVIIPTVWASEVLVSAILRGIESLGTLSLPSLWRDFLTLHPQFDDIATHVLNIVPLHEIINRLSAVVEAQAQHLLKYSIQSGVHVLVTLGIVFFMLKDHTLFFRALKTLTPLPSNETEILFTRVLDTIQGVIFGVVAVALIQGFLGGILLWWLEIPGVAIWATIMTLLALIPYLGTFVIWIPISLFLLLQGDWMQGLVTIGWGSIIIGLSDNVLYPILVGKRIHYHPLLIFIFLFGGILVAGSAGIILGPVILASTDRLLWIWRKRM